MRPPAEGASCVQLKVRSAQSLASISSCLARPGTLAIGRPWGAWVQSTIEPGYILTFLCPAISESANQSVIRFVRDRLGYRYDLRNVVDLARYLLPTPPVPVRWRRRMLALGSGDPTRAICSTLIAMAFQSVRYPILPEIESVASRDPLCRGCVDEILQVRHHSLFVPRDFDVSPYFEVVKPTLACGFDRRLLRWQDGPRVPRSVLADAPESKPA